MHACIALLVSLALLPVAAAGPFEDSPLATHEEECHASWEYRYAPEGGGDGWFSSEGCSERHYVGAGDAEVARVEAGERAANGSDAHGWQTYGVRNGTHYHEYESAYHSFQYKETYARADAAGASASLVQGCGDEQVHLSEQELLSTDDGVHTWGTSGESAAQHGCWTSATVAQGDAQVARAEAFDGCRYERTSVGTFEQDYNAPGGIAYTTREASEGGSACGRTVSGAAAGEDASVHRGDRCEGEGSYGSFSNATGGSYAWTWRESCIDGLHAEARDAWIGIGEKRFDAETCGNGSCSSSSDPAGEGLFFRVAGHEGDAPVPVDWLHLLP